jgi:uncharacterized DUF497 family protein
MAKSKAPIPEDPTPSDPAINPAADSGEVVDVAVIVEEPAAPAKPKRSLATTIGKAVTLTNFVIALLFVATSFFYYSQKLQVNQRKSSLDQITRELNTLQTDRQAIIAALEQEKTAEEERLKAVGTDGEKELATIDASIAQTRTQIESARKVQRDLSDQSDSIQKDQAVLISEIQTLRETLEATLGEKEAEIAERIYLEDQLAKTLNDLREARRRQKEVASSLGR